MSAPTSTPAPGQRPRRHRRHRSRRAAVPARLVAAVALVATTAVVVVLLVGSTSGAGGGGCGSGAAALRVVVDPTVAAPVRAAAAALTPAGGGGCPQVTVLAQDSAATAAALGTSARRPDVWIPDSSLWLRRAAAHGWRPPAPVRSAALSPVVLAVAPQAARRAGWPARRLDPLRVLDPAAPAPLRLTLADPQRSAAAVGGLLAVQDALRGRPADLADVLRRAHRATPALPALGDAAVPVAEQAVAAAATAAGPAAVAVYPRHPMTLDYPVVVLAASGPAAARAAALQASLLHGVGRDRLLAAGFRDPRTGGAARGALRREQGVDPQPVPPAVPSAASAAAAVRAAEAVSAPSRLLAVVDVSGSMGTTVPGANGATRLDLVTQAAARGLALYPDNADIGLWVFATNLTPRADYRELVPLGPLATRPDGVPGRERLVQALGQVSRVPGGGTGLYDTTLAAVRAVRRGWDPDRANSVVLLTDGRNDDPRGIGLADLVGTLRREAAGGRPVPVHTIAYGGDSDVPALTAISRATGGRLYQAQDPRTIGAVFLDAIGRRACAPGC